MTGDPAASDRAEASIGNEPGRDVIEVGGERRRTTRTSGGTSAARWIAAFLGLAAVIVLQIAILQRLGSSDDDLAATRAALTDLQVDVRGIDDRIDDIGEQVDSLEIVASSGAASSAQTSGASLEPGALPPFTDPSTDLAVRDGYVLGELSAVEYYTEAATTIAPSDGVARVWLVWAHWCPYCQQELPALAQWYPENADRFPNTELVTITTSMDETRGNPLAPYLEQSQFPFPVLVDPDLALATQFGTNAFPFWVVTDGDGTVVFRVAGAIGVDAIEAIFTQVEAMAGA